MEKIHWTNNKSYDHNLITDRIKFVEKNMNGLLPLYGREKEKLITYAEKNNIPTEELMSIRNQVKIQKEIKASRFLSQMQPIVKKNFVNLVSNQLLESYPPKKFVGSQILSFIKKSKLPLPIIFKIITPMTEFKLLDKNTFYYYYFNLIIKIIRQKELTSRKKSQEFEDDLAAYLKKNYPHDFYTENDIKAQKLHHITPDILFKEPVQLEVNGEIYTIRWIDAKNYILINTPFMLTSLKKQAEKYNNAFGMGAFVFHYGFDSSIKIPGVIMLDGSFL